MCAGTNIVFKFGIVDYFKYHRIDVLYMYIATTMYIAYFDYLRPYCAETVVTVRSVKLKDYGFG